MFRWNCQWVNGSNGYYTKVRIYRKGIHSMYGIYTYRSINDTYHVYFACFFQLRQFVIKIPFFAGLLFYAPKWSFCIWPDANRKRTTVSWSDLIFVTSLRDGRYYHCGKSQQSTPARDLGTHWVFASQDARYLFKQNEWFSLIFPLCHFPNCPRWRTTKKFSCKTHIISIQQRSQQLRYTNPKQKKRAWTFPLKS